MTFRYQTAVTLILAAVLTLMIGCVRPLPKLDSSDAYWARKMLWGPQFDVVLAGDSRVNRGLAPSVMIRHLTGERIANFAFQSTGFTDDYLSEIERRLDPGGSRIIVIGVTTVSLTPRAARENKFLEMRRKHAAELQQQISLKTFLEFLRPIEWEDPNESVQERTGSKVKIFHSDGWTAVADPRSDERSSIPFFEEYYVNNQVSSEIVDQLIEAVGNWTSSGIKVFGFRPPTTVEMYRLEERLAGFNEREFVTRFKNAGGIWLEFEHGKYATHDGSHLVAREARKFSIAVARQILKSTEK